MDESRVRSKRHQPGETRAGIGLCVSAGIAPISFRASSGRIPIFIPSGGRQGMWSAALKMSRYVLEKPMTEGRYRFVGFPYLPHFHFDRLAFATSTRAAS